MSIEKKCENCNHYEKLYECMYNVSHCDNFEFWQPNEELVRQDERSKFITLLKSDLGNFDGLANECAERKDIHELLENNAVRKYIESTIELLEKN